jgi:hypothetical protein
MVVDLRDGAVGDAACLAFAGIGEREGVAAGRGKGAGLVEQVVAGAGEDAWVGVWGALTPIEALADP